MRLEPHVVNFMSEVLVVVIVHGKKSLLVKLLVKNYYEILYKDEHALRMSSEMIIAFTIEQYYNLKVWQPKTFAKRYSLFKCMMLSERSMSLNLHLHVPHILRKCGKVEKMLSSSQKTSSSLLMV